MRVLHVTDALGSREGGSGSFVDQLVGAMSAQGITCAVLAQKARGQRKAATPAYPVRRFSNPHSTRWAGWWIRRHIGAMEKRQGLFDVYIGYHAFPPGYACVKHSRRVGRPAIVCSRAADLGDLSKWRRKPGAWKKLSWALANAAAVICVSEEDAAKVRQVIGISAAEGRLICLPAEDIKAKAPEAVGGGALVGWGDVARQYIELMRGVVERWGSGAG